MRVVGEDEDVRDGHVQAGRDRLWVEQDATVGTVRIRPLN